MKKIIILLVFLTSMIPFAEGQIKNIKKQNKKCYEKTTTAQGRYAEWQCGKLAGVVDCNERLEYDQSRDLVLLSAAGRNISNMENVGKPFTGTCETCHMNGILARRIKFVNGKEDGIDTTYYMSGCKQVVRNHLKGVEHGQWLYYYDSTEQLAWEMNYYLGEKHGKQFFFRKNGDTIKWENYKNGRLDGVKRTYYPDSKIKREVTYKEGVYHGPFKIYNLKGRLLEEINYVDGKKDGEAKYYYEDGKPLRIEHWKEGIKNGEFKTFFYQGNPQEIQKYYKGKKHGLFIEYYPNGKMKVKKLYEKDELIEEHRYDEHGRETYSFGAPEQKDVEDDEMPVPKKKRKKKKTKK